MLLHLLLYSTQLHRRFYVFELFVQVQNSPFMSNSYSVNPSDL